MDKDRFMQPVDPIPIHSHPRFARESPRQCDRWSDGTRLTERQLRAEQEQAASALDGYDDVMERMAFWVWFLLLFPDFLGFLHLWVFQFPESFF